ncbi:MAG TPA: YcxB family protein [Terriglobia bacterium]|nr:YcxB family protein [Terriglobia bacterium]
MKTQYSLTPQDYREYQELYLTRIAGFWEKYHFRIFVTFGAICFAAGLNWIVFEHRETYPGWVALVGGLYLLFSGVWGRWKWRHWFRKNAELYQNLDGEITDDNLTVRSGTVETCARWEHYSRFVESQNLLLLLDPQGSWLVLPKRAFAPEDFHSFVKFLRDKLSTR